MDILFAAVLPTALLAVLAGELAVRPPAIAVDTSETSAFPPYSVAGYCPACAPFCARNYENLAFPSAAMVDPQSIDPSHWKDRMQT
ncbi:hypothetical protein B0H11DRAFT_2225830 [Mycena galericulata]|nr:hypothetical protein B0H11DRAFT_2225830 [Mycena galericulata]